MAENESTHHPADAPPPDGADKNRTMRISLDSARPREPKKATGLVSGIPTHTGPIPQTIRLKRPPTSPITVQTADLAPPPKKAGDTALVQIPPTVRTVTAETVKRQTARIGLAGLAAPKSPLDFKQTSGPILGIPTHTGPIPPTIRLKRPPTPSAMRPPTATVVAKPSDTTVLKDDGQAISEAPTIVKHIVTPRTPTAHIVLDEWTAPIPAAAATPQIPPGTTAEPPAPKTIRLKQPASLSAADETDQIKVMDETLKTVKKGGTAKIDLPFKDSALMPITQRKTIKVKRTDYTITPRSATPEAAAAPEPGARMEAPAPDEEQGLVFSLVAVAATLCLAVLVYIMVAQTFGVHLLLPPSMQLH